MTIIMIYIGKFHHENSPSIILQVKYYSTDILNTDI